jgi:hypothetical protein
MRCHFWHALSGIAALLLLVLGGCGSNSSGGGSAQQGTPTGGPVSIGTDRTTYAPSDSIAVSVTNNLSTSIYAYDTRASCTILDLQMQVNSTWQATQVARCPLGRPAMRVEIAAHKTYTATITAGFLGISQAAFPTGTYRLVLMYSTSATTTPQQTMTTLYSATFSVSVLSR